ncbi:DUF2147 domain-containing protein [Aquimarina sp. AU119]|uniref:DUF2147 domain-containing protein n=1 Tax=Aquimarina sp. AU119 TaxID=2108528 RepID=UPI000D685677|nr:DUF2147 domain-containing protein [Aquimarina sp. AU119]
MKQITLSILLFVSSITIAQKSTDNFEGNWKMEEGFIVHITKLGDSFKGIVIEKDKLILEDITFSNQKWKGTLTKPKDGKKMACELILDGQKLKVKVSKGFVSKTLIWTKQ